MPKSGQSRKSQGSSLGSSRSSKRQKQSSYTGDSRTNNAGESQTTNDVNARVDEVDINSGIASGQNSANQTMNQDILQNSNFNLDINALTEKITMTVTNAVMNNLRATGLLQSQPQASQTASQVQVASSPVQGTSSESQLGNDFGSLASSSTTSSAILNCSDISSSQSSFTANVEAAKSGFVSAAIPLHSRVPMKTKEKIWNNEFVEFSTLHDEEVDDITISVKSGKITTTGSARKKFMSIEQWTDAFNVFASVYRLKFPEQSEQLFIYLNTIRKISSENGHWHYYDINFRKIRQSIGLRWDQIHSELYVTALTRKQKQPFRQPRDLLPSGRSRANFKSTCNKFNRGSNCSGCDYRHICRYCGGKHPGFRCWKEHSSRFDNNSLQSKPPSSSQGSLSNVPKPSRTPTPSDTGSAGNFK